MRRRGALGAALACCLAAAAAAQDLPTPEEVGRQWRSRLDGRHFMATVALSVEGRGGRRSVVRSDASGERARILLRHEEPRSVRGRSWLLRETADGGVEIFGYSTRVPDEPPRPIPSFRMSDPLLLADWDFVGLPLGGARSAQPKSVERAELDGRSVVVLTEENTDDRSDFDRRRVWLDPESWLPLRAEHERGGETVLVAETLETRAFHGVLMPVLMRFESGGEELHWRYETVDFRRPIRPRYFELPETF